MKIFRDIISSRSNSTVKWAASLADKKGRTESRAFIAEGEKLTFEALKRRLPVSHVFVREDRWESLLSQIMAYNDIDDYAECQIVCLSEGAFSKISTEKAPQP